MNIWIYIPKAILKIQKLGVKLVKLISQINYYNIITSGTKFGLWEDYKYVIFGYNKEIKLYQQ